MSRPMGIIVFGMVIMCLTPQCPIIFSITVDVVSSNPARVQGYWKQHYMLEFVSDLQHVSGFLLGTPTSSTNKTDHHYITEILLKYAFNTITRSLFLLMFFVIFINIYVKPSYFKCKEIESYDLNCMKWKQFLFSSRSADLY